MYTHWMDQPRGPGTLPHTHMTPLKAVNLIDSSRSFREGRTAFRNVADKAKEYRVQFINDANRRNGIVSPPPPTIVPRSTRKPLSCQARKPLSCQAHVVETSDSDPGNSSEDEVSEDGEYKTVKATPKRLATSSPSPKPTIQRRKPNDSDSEEESSRGLRRRDPSKAKVVTISPGRLSRREPSPRRSLRPRRGSRRP